MFVLWLLWDIINKKILILIAEEDPAVEQGMNNSEAQIDPESSVQSCQTNLKATNSICPEDLKPLDVKPLEEDCHDSALDPLESPTGMTRTEEGLSQGSDMELSSLTGDKGTVQLKHKTQGRSNVYNTERSLSQN